MRARDLMQRTSEVVHVDQSLLEALIRLRRYDLPAIAAVDGDEIVGLLSAEAIEKKAASPDNDFVRVAVRDLVSTEIAFCRADEDTETARTVMQEGGHDHLLVTDPAGKLCGILSRERLLGGSEARDNGASGEERAHVVESSGRAKGDSPHHPPNFAVGPRLKKDS